jgi:hypothetical protein
MTESVFVIQPTTRTRQTKFTPERIQQIINLVERGKSRNEIAEIVGVTPATLQVTCSRLKISLRRPTFSPGTGLLQHRRKRTSTRSISQREDHKQGDIRPDHEHVLPTGDEAGSSEGALMRVSSPSIGGDKIAERLQLGIRMRYKNEDRTVPLPLASERLGQLALEADLRDMRMTELIASVILRVAERDLFDLVLDSPAPYPGNGRSRSEHL